MVKSPDIMPERYYIVIIPDQAGTADELMARTSVGILRRDAFIRREEQNLAGFLEGIPQDERVSFERIYRLSHDIPNRGYYVLDLRDEIHWRYKSQIYEPAIEAMKRVGERLRVNVPDDLLTRLHLVGPRTFQNILLQETNVDEFSVNGVCLPNRLCFLNFAEAKKRSGKDIGRLEYLLKRTGIHEMWHSLMYGELWMPASLVDMSTNQLPPLRYRRAGLTVNRPAKRSEASQGLDMFNEAFMDYLTWETIEGMGERVVDVVYAAELRALDLLIEKIGDEPLARAAFTRHGLKEFFDILNNKYGRHAPKKLGEALASDHGRRIISQVEGGRDPGYRGTMKFLRSEIGDN